MEKLKNYYSKIEDRIKGTFAGTRGEFMPLSFQVNLLNKCYQHCIGCRKYEWPDVKLEKDKVKEMIQWFSSKNTKSVIFSGGEPLLFDGIEEVICDAITKKLKVGILTSGLWPEKLDIERIMEHMNGYIAVSFDGGYETTYAKCRGINSFEKVIENMRILSTLKKKRNPTIRLKLHATMSNKNHREMAAILNIAQNCEFDECNFYPIHTWDELKMNSGDKETIVNSIYGAMSIKEIKSNVNNFMDLLKRKETVKCMIPWVHSVIDSNGDVYFCCRTLDDNGEFGKRNSQYSIGNVNKESLNDIFLINSKSDEMRKRLYNAAEEVCLECDRYCVMNEHFNKHRVEKDCGEEIFL